MLLFVGHDRQSKHSGPYKFKPVTLDLSVTSAYEPATTPVSITQLPSSPLYLQRTTSQHHPPRPSLSPEHFPPNRPRTYSTSSSSTGVNGRRPVPAPRLSISGREAADYQAIDNSMPDVQIKDSNSPASYAFGQSFLYPERHEQALPATKNAAFSRASTLPISAQRPQLDAELTRVRSKSPDGEHRRRVSEHLPPAQFMSQHIDTGSQYDTESITTSLASTLEYKSSRSSRRGANNNIKRINSRTSLTDLEKSERRKSDLLESSPYPQLYNLALDDEKSPSPSSAKNHNNNTTDAAGSTVADPIYSQIRKPTAAQPTTNSDGRSAHAVSTFGLTTNAGIAGDSFNMAKQYGEEYSTPLHAGGHTSPIYERIDAISSSPPRSSIAQWQRASQGLLLPSGDMFQPPGIHNKQQPTNNPFALLTAFF